jgi:DnaJ-class molecular chaperone
MDNFEKAQLKYDNELPELEEMDCKMCDGDGKIWDDGAPDAVPITCPNCQGKGYIKSIDKHRLINKKLDE